LIPLPQASRDRETWRSRLPAWVKDMVLDVDLGSAPGGAVTPSFAGNECELTTSSGFGFNIRSANESDEALLAEFFTHVSEDDLRFRFLSAVHKVGHAQLALLTQVDHRQSENFLAFHPVVGCLLASAMLAIDDDLEHAEVAIVVRADFKNQGVGWCLLEHVADHAARMGVKTLQAIESRDNGSAIRVEREMGFTSRACPGDAALTILEKSLTTRPERVAGQVGGTVLGTRCPQN
jgi:GNAT superfamily N-acetyltransferase